MQAAKMNFAQRGIRTSRARHHPSNTVNTIQGAGPMSKLFALVAAVVLIAPAAYAALYQAALIVA
jgi:hypothetical protein